MSREAELERTESGVVPKTAGWFVVNVADAAWIGTEQMGSGCRFEGAERFGDLGINVRVLQPDEPACMYHRESQQEAFLVLHGECKLLIDGEERALRRWDFVHCPPNVDHVFVGAGSGPCAILMVGARKPDVEITYPVSELAKRYGASVENETHLPQEAYAKLTPPHPVPAPPPFDS